jgi:uncharacterized protein (TIGR00369 family)
MASGLSGKPTFGWPGNQPLPGAPEPTQHLGMSLVDSISQLSPAALASSPRNVIRELWDRMSRIPGGKRLFSKLAGQAAPYSATIGAEVEELRRGYAAVRMRDSRKVRNHLSSIHAVALVNLAELTGNIALSYTLPDDARFIVAGLSIDYLKKARGTLRATSECPLIDSSEKREVQIPVVLWNEAGEEVARATLRSLIGPKPAAAASR